MTSIASPGSSMCGCSRSDPTAPSTPPASTTTSTRSVIYYRALDKALHAVDASGAPKWTFLTQGSSAAVSGDGTVFFGSEGQEALRGVPRGHAGLVLRDRGPHRLVARDRPRGRDRRRVARRVGVLLPVGGVARAARACLGTPAILSGTPVVCRNLAISRARCSGPPAAR